MVPDIKAQGSINVLTGEKVDVDVDWWRRIEDKWMWGRAGEKIDVGPCCVANIVPEIMGQGSAHRSTGEKVDVDMDRQKRIDE